MIHEILPVGLLQCNCSIIGDENSREALVVDPGDEIEQILAILNRHQLLVRYIIITHAHIDHIGGARKLKDRTGAPVYLNEQDLELYSQMDLQALWLGVPPPETTAVDALIRDGDEIRWGELQATILHTPGHTQGSISLLIPQCTPAKLLAGDTLFYDSIGRTDLPGGNDRQILKSLKEKLLILDDSTIVVPGHGPVTSIGREREWNPFLQNL
ncbi:MAG: MBL fold metallo-hydrolase [Acidobacteria bacterium]|nr:MBL fold metallo-hydrolase [Acidobacteriota bacterium]